MFGAAPGAPALPYAPAPACASYATPGPDVGGSEPAAAGAVSAGGYCVVSSVWKTYLVYFTEPSSGPGGRGPSNFATMTVMLS